MKNEAWNFDVETSVSAIEPDRYHALLSSAWNISQSPNGGYALIPGVRAMAHRLDRPDPLTVTAHYLRPCVGDEAAVIDTSVVRSGRRASTATASLQQQGTERVRLLGAFGDLSAGSSGHDQQELGIEPPDMPPPEECPPRTELEQGVELPILSRIDIRVDPRWAHRGDAASAEVSGWIRLADGRPADAIALALFADAFPPSIFSLFGRVGWVPTIELTVQVRRRPEPGWIRGRFTTQDVTGGLLVEDGVLWDDTGLIVARSRQLAIMTMD